MVIAYSLTPSNTKRFQFLFELFCDSGRTDIVRILIEKGAEVDAKSENLWTPLHLASQFGNYLEFCFRILKIF